jgi:hypothetical protein
VLVDTGPIGSAQGIAATPDDRFLFVADCVRGVVRVDLETREVRLLPTPENLLTSGVDGLVLAGDSLVGIVNGLRPHCVVRLRLVLPWPSEPGPGNPGPSSAPAR